MNGGSIKQAAAAAVALAVGAPAQGQERPSVAPKAMQAIAPGLADYTDHVLFGDVWVRPELSPRDRSLVTLSVLIATGKTAQLSGHLGRGLANGLKPTEVAGIVTQLAFYTGWPNAVSALAAIEPVFAERKIDTSDFRKIEAAMPHGPTPDIADIASPVDDVAPKLAQLTHDVVLGDLWRRTDLSPRDRSLVTIAALAANDDPDQLATYIRLGIRNGLTQGDIGEALTHLAFYAGWPKAMGAVAVAKQAFGEDGKATAHRSATGIRVIAPGTAPTSATAANFTGSATVTSAFKGTDGAQAGGATVSFQPGAHTNWHRHPLGQLLIVTAGRGWVQAEGEPVHAMTVGDTVWIAPGVKHWHGATRDSAMTHVAVAESRDGQTVTWLGPVSDAQYHGPDR